MKEQCNTNTYQVAAAHKVTLVKSVVAVRPLVFLTLRLAESIRTFALLPWDTGAVQTTMPAELVPAM
jgi:hypothetical protein